MIENSLCGFTKAKACRTNLLTFCDEMMSFTDEGRAVYVVCLDFGKVFNVVKLEGYGLNREKKGLCLLVQYPAKRQLPAIPQKADHWDQCYVFIHKMTSVQVRQEALIISCSAELYRKGGALLEVTHRKDER